MPIYAQSSTLRTLLIPLVDVDQTTLQQDDILQYNSTTGKFENQTLTSGGQAVITTASNTGLGNGVFKQKTNQDLEFKSLTAGAGITLTANADDIEISTVGADATGANVGTGIPVFVAKVGDDIQLRSLNTGVGNQHLTIALGGASNDEILFVNTAEINQGSNIGGGAQIYESKVGENLQFRTLVGGDNITVTTIADEIQISSNSPVNTATSFQFTVNFDGSGNVISATDMPAGWTSVVNGNEITVSHTANTMVKNVSYWGSDSLNGWQLRFPTVGYQATIPAGNELTQFKIDVNATVAGADASSSAKVNVIF